MDTPKVYRTYGGAARARRSFASSTPKATPEQRERVIVQDPSSPPSLLASSSPAPVRCVDRPSKRGYAAFSGADDEGGDETDVPARPIVTPPAPKKLRMGGGTLKEFFAATPPKASTSSLSKCKSVSKSATSKSTKLPAHNSQNKVKPLTQLHFNTDAPVLRTCPTCDLSYTRGAPDDEALHRAHCARVRSGMEWGREEARAGGSGVVQVIEEDVRLSGGNGKLGRIVCFPASVGGKIGAKLDTLLQTINLSLSAPPLPDDVLKSAKAYLFLLPHEGGAAGRERIVGCVIAQRIEEAMAVVDGPLTSSMPTSDASSREPAPIAVDSATHLFCSPTKLPTPMGVPRLFVPAAHRRQGIARALLDAAARTFVYGCPLDPRKGEVAFSQPTGMGQKVMRAWGGGAVRVFEE